MGSRRHRGGVATVGIALLVVVSTAAAPAGHPTATVARPAGEPVTRRPPLSDVDGVDGGVVPAVPPPSLPLPPLSISQPAPPVAVVAVDPVPPVSYVGGIPSVVLGAYLDAATALAREQPNCRLPVALLAAIGKVESGHARGGRLDSSGNAVPPILGPELNGTNGFAAIPATDGGALDGDPVWERAVGPMQFIPSTWRNWASDGNHDGIADPENIYDATLAAARYLCADGRDLSTDAGIRSAILSYNDSVAYLRLVTAWLTAYRGGITEIADVTMPASPTTTTTPAPTPTTTTAAPTSTPITPTPTPTPTTTPVTVIPIPVPTTSTITTTAQPVPTTTQSGGLLCDLRNTLGGLAGLLGLGPPPPPC